MSPIDFDALQAANGDIYAWMTIPGMDIDHPVLQNEKDDEYYLRRDSMGNSDRRGCLFTQHTYNGTDFNDPVTVIYSHNSSDAVFADLQKTYSSPAGMRDHQELIIYLPEGELRYTVFAGVPYSNAHILYYHDFRSWSVYEEFLDEIRSTRSMGSCVDGEVKVEPSDRILILSTCLKGNSKKRFLVVAVRQD